MLADVYAAVAAIPEGVAKVIGAGVAGGAGTLFYLWGRLRRLPPVPEAAVPRVALSETDRELGFTVIRTGTDLARALHDHGEILRRSLPPTGDAEPPFPPPASGRRARARRP